MEESSAYSESWERARWEEIENETFSVSNIRHGAGTPEPESDAYASHSQQNLATLYARQPAVLFMDYDNIFSTLKNEHAIDLNTDGLMERFVRQMKHAFSLHSMSAYANFESKYLLYHKPPKTIGHQSELQRLGFQTKHFMHGKNSADMLLIAEAIEHAILSKTACLYIIVSADKDMLVLLMKLRALGKRVMFITTEKNADVELIMNYADVFDFFENLVNLPLPAKDINKEEIISFFHSISAHHHHVSVDLFLRECSVKKRVDRMTLEPLLFQLIKIGVFREYPFTLNHRTYTGLRLCEENVPPVTVATQPNKPEEHKPISNPVVTPVVSPSKRNVPLHSLRESSVITWKLTDELIVSEMRKTLQIHPQCYFGGLVNTLHREYDFRKAEVIEHIKDMIERGLLHEHERMLTFSKPE